MATAKANGLLVLEASIKTPRVGAWRAELELDGDDASKASGTVTLEVGSVTWTGKAVESGAFVGRVKVNLVGGAGGLGKPAKARFYHAIPARTVLEDLLAEGGERLSPTSDAAKLGTILPFWTRPAGTVSEGLENVLEAIGAVWRVLADGAIWIGVETWPKSSPANVEVESESPQESKIVFASDEPTLLPGTTFRDRKVSRVEHSITGGKTRTTAWFETGDGSQPTDAFRGALAGLIRQETKHTDFMAARSGKVVAQNNDGTLELKLDDADMPGMSKIPIAYGVPGIKAKVKKGAKVLVQWADGLPSKPHAVVIDSAAIEELAIDSTIVKVAGAEDFVALAKKVDNALAAIVQWGASHIHSTSQGPSGPAMPALTSQPSVAATKLRTD